MKKIVSSFVLSTALLAINMGSLSLATPLYAEEEVTTVSHSFMSDKTEIAVDLEVSGAEALCQTDDGFVWIGQYSGLTRYDSDEYVTYKSFNENGTEYSIINIRGLAADQNTLYVATHKNIFAYKDYQFSYVDIDAGVIKGIVLDEDNDFLYIFSADKGATLYDINNNKSSKLPNLETGNVNDIALDKKRDTYYYQTDTGVFEKNGKQIYLNSKILDIYSFDDILYIGDDSGLLRRYDMANGVFLDDINITYQGSKGETGDQINKFLYSEEDKILFVACENSGLYCINLANDTPIISLAGDLENKSQLVDLMIDYQGNLWIASHFIGASGVSIITKNALLDLLYDDVIWSNVPEAARKIFAIERYGDILYLISSLRIYLYDLKQNKILEDNIIMQEIDAYATINAISYGPRDIEVFDDKIYFAINGIGLVEYNPTSNNVTIYDASYITSHIDKLVGEPDLTLVNAMRVLRKVDNYLAIGYSRGVMKFDGEKFSIMFTGPTSVLYLGESKDKKLLYCRSVGIFEVSEDFSTVTQLPLIEGVEGNVLKFLVDDNKIYYNLNSRLFRLEKNDDKYVSYEIAIPHVKGSIVEISKISYIGQDNITKYKYVIASETQIYITDSLDVERLENYEFYDSTNGLKAISANTSGYYDNARQEYYFQSSNGIFVYDFNEKVGTVTPVKIGISSITLDDEEYFGNVINIKKDIYRVSINMSIFGFKPNKGYTLYYKLDGVDKDYHTITDGDKDINYTNLAGGTYHFHAYAIDEYGQMSNELNIKLVKEMHIYEHVWFWVIVALLALSLVIGIAFMIIQIRTRRALRKQLEYKNITIESIQAIARTIDAKDEYTNGHSTRVGYYSKLIAQNLGMNEDEVDNIYYIALLHDIGKIAIPDKILNKPGKLTDEEYAVMKSHTTRGAKILKGISTIPHIIEGAKSHHEKWDGSGYPEGLKGEEIPYVARIICCADCFDAMATKRVYKEPVALEDIANEFERCEGTHFDPDIAKVVVNMMRNGKLKPYTVENAYFLGDDGKTYRVTNNHENKDNK